MTDRKSFDTYLTLLRRVVTARGGDLSAVGAQFYWPGASSMQAPAPKAAVSLAPLLTGDGGVATSMPRASITQSESGIVAVPRGLDPPKP